jgi:hypothetical protein
MVSYNILRSSLKKHTLTLALSPQGRDLRIAPSLRGEDKGEGV